MTIQSVLCVLRAPKIFGLAIFDMLMVYLFVVFVVNATSRFKKPQFVDRHTMGMYIIFLIIASGIHYLMNIPTMMNYYLGFTTLDAVMHNRSLECPNQVIFN